MQLTGYSQPTPLVSKILSNHQPGRALDIGSFEGRNALYLAELGWKVVAIDTDDVVLQKLQTAADDKSLPVTTQTVDLRNYKPNAPFNAILSLMVLHFLPKKDINPSIVDMQKWTSPGGINIVTVFTADNPPGTRPYLFARNELKDYYSDWDIKEYEETYSSWIIPEGKTEPERYMVARLVAVKPSLQGNATAS